MNIAKVNYIDRKYFSDWVEVEEEEISYVSQSTYFPGILYLDDYCNKYFFYTRNFSGNDYESFFSLEIV